MGKNKHNAVDTDGVASSTCLELFSGLEYELCRLYLPRTRRAVEEPAIKRRYHTRSGFLSLMRSVRQKIEDRQIVLILIEDASRLDTYALNWLMDLRQESEQPFGLVLAATLRAHEEASAPLAPLFSQVPRAADTRARGLQVSQLDSTAARREVYPNLIKALGWGLDKELLGQVKLLTDLLWEQSGSNWHLIARNFRVFTQVLDKHGTQVLSVPIVEQFRQTMANPERYEGEKPTAAEQSQEAPPKTPSKRTSRKAATSKAAPARSSKKRASDTSQKETTTESSDAISPA